MARTERDRDGDQPQRAHAPVVAEPRLHPHNLLKAQRYFYTNRAGIVGRCATSPHAFREIVARVDFRVARRTESHHATRVQTDQASTRGETRMRKAVASMLVLALAMAVPGSTSPVQAKAGNMIRIATLAPRDTDLTRGFQSKSTAVCAKPPATHGASSFIRAALPAMRRTSSAR